MNMYSEFTYIFVTYDGVRDTYKWIAIINNESVY
jgi:hypothetical protein